MKLNKLLSVLFLLVAMCVPVGLTGCKASLSTGGSPNVVDTARQKLADLPEPTFQTIEVYVHDLSSLGVKNLVKSEPDTKIPLRVLADSALSVLTTETVTMVDVLELSNSLDEVKSGKVKVYLDIAWTLLELNGVVRRNDLTAVLTQREQRLLIALFQGIKLGTGDPAAVNEKLNAVGPRY